MIPSVKVPIDVLQACAKLNPNLHSVLLSSNRFSSSSSSSGGDLVDEEDNENEGSEGDAASDIEMDRSTLTARQEEEGSGAAARGGFGEASASASASTPDLSQILSHQFVVNEDIYKKNQAFIMANLEKIYVSMVLSPVHCIDDLAVTMDNVASFLKTLLDIVVVGLSGAADLETARETVSPRIVDQSTDPNARLALMSIRIMTILVKRFPNKDKIKELTIVHDVIVQVSSKVFVLKRIPNITELPWYIFPLFELMFTICKSDETIQRNFIKKLCNVFFQLERLLLVHACVPSLKLIGVLIEVLPKLDSSGEVMVVAALMRVMRMNHLPKMQLLACQIITDLGPNNPGIVHNGIGRRETEDELYRLLTSRSICNNYDSLYYVLGASTVCVRNMNAKPKWSSRPWMYSWRAYTGGLFDRVLLQSQTVFLIERLMRSGRGLYIIPIFAQALSLAVALMYNCTDDVITSFASSPSRSKNRSSNSSSSSSGSGSGRTSPLSHTNSAAGLQELLNDPKAVTGHLRTTLIEIILPAFVPALKVIGLGASYFRYLDPERESEYGDGDGDGDGDGSLSSKGSTNSIISMLETEESSIDYPSYRASTMNDREFASPSPKNSSGKPHTFEVGGGSNSPTSKSGGLGLGMKVSLSESNLASYTSPPSRGAISRGIGHTKVEGGAMLHTAGITAAPARTNNSITSINSSGSSSNANFLSSVKSKIDSKIDSNSKLVVVTSVGSSSAPRSTGNRARLRGTSEEAVNDTSKKRIVWNRDFFQDKDKDKNKKSFQNAAIELLAEKTVDGIFTFLCLEEVFPLATYQKRLSLFKDVPIISNLSNVMSKFPTNTKILKRGMEVFKCFAVNDLELRALATKASPALLVAVTSVGSDMACQVLFCKVVAAIGRADDFAIESAIRYGVHVPIYEFIAHSEHQKVGVEACLALASLARSKDIVEQLCSNGINFLDVVGGFLGRVPSDKAVQIEGLRAMTGLTAWSKEAFKASHLAQYKRTVKFIKELLMSDNDLLPDYSKEHVESLLTVSMKNQKSCVIS